MKVESYRSTPLAVLVVALLAAGSALLAQTDAATPMTPTGDYFLELDGQRVAGAEVFTARGVGYLVLADELDAPVLLRPGSTEVETLNFMKVDRREDGTVRLLPGARLSGEGRFTVEGEGVVFTVAGRAAALRATPPLLGAQDLDGMAAYSPDYARDAEQYTCSEPVLNALKSYPEDVRVSIYFGSWCPYCKQVVPRAMKVAERLDGSRIQVDFYGLPRQIGDDARASELEISGVPTGIIYSGGREIGRIQGGDWKIPELAIKNVLDGAS